jgi:hypothetical protein
LRMEWRTAPSRSASDCAKKGLAFDMGIPLASVSNGKQCCRGWAGYAGRPTGLVFHRLTDGSILVFRRPGQFTNSDAFFSISAMHVQFRQVKGGTVSVHAAHDRAQLHGGSAPAVHKSIHRFRIKGRASPAPSAF